MVVRMENEKNVKENEKSSKISFSIIEFLGLFLILIGTLIAIFSPRMGDIENTMAALGYIIIILGILVIFIGCIFSVFSDRKKSKEKDEEAAASDNPANVDISNSPSNEDLSRMNQCNIEMPFEQSKLALSSPSTSEDGHRLSIDEPPPSYYEAVGISS
ncbi:uncharacterized protein LOC111622399 isoform X1 [Centruroides sculpturatus]|uniref:uncharacterized protein LOC111622399 isoform X1 n=2 Tax=Centruroides sculpturatus TaxID=218467 RepID=UPI000C6E2750|nr:uncharacterized protein LOC111622399 isoform X1 [Centruroides sculpturatus]